MSHFAAIAAAALIAATWQGAILAALVALTLRLLPEFSAATRSLIWTATFALLVALHFLPAAHPGAVAAATAPLHPVHVASIWSVVLASMWFILATFRAVQFALSAHRLQQINRRAHPISSSMCELFPAEGRGKSGSDFEALQASRPYTLCTSPDVDRPSVLGFFHPRILLPTGLIESLSPAELQQILLHETEHLRRSDDWTNLLQKLALVLLPLNPVLFWVERRLCLERELACDARVLSACETPRKSYATTLTRLAEHSIMRRGFNLALGILGQRPQPSELSTRVHRILAQPALRMTRVQSRLATATILSGVLALSTTLAHAPSLITFSADATTEQATNLAAPALARETWTPKLVQAKATLPASSIAASSSRATSLQGSSRQNTSASTYGFVEVVSRTPVPTRHRLKKVHQLQAASSAPRLFDTNYRIARPGQPSQTDIEQQRLTLMVAGPQVQQFVVPAVAYVPAAYAAVRTPDGWIIFQL